MYLKIAIAYLNNTYKVEKYWCHDIRSKHCWHSVWLHFTWLKLKPLCQLLFMHARWFIYFVCHRSNICHILIYLFGLYQYLLRNINNVLHVNNESTRHISFDSKFNIYLYQMHYCKYCNYCVVTNIPCGEKINFPYICLDPLLHMSCIYMWQKSSGRIGICR